MYSFPQSNPLYSFMTDKGKKVILANKRAHPLFSGLYRSKGSFWLATRPGQAGDWSQAGVHLALCGGNQWFCTLPEDDWGASAELAPLIRADMVPPWGDRQQQIVFIGEKLDRCGIEELFDGCLLSEEEMKLFAELMQSDDGSDDDGEMDKRLRQVFDDGFPAWAGLDEEPGDVDDAVNGHDHDHSHVHGKHYRRQHHRIPGRANEGEDEDMLDDEPFVHVDKAGRTDH